MDAIAARNAADPGLVGMAANLEVLRMDHDEMYVQGVG